MTTCGTLNEGRGRNPGDSRIPFRSGLPFGVGAQRRPGPKPRRQSPPRTHPLPARTPLNEGRGRNPGDSLMAHVVHYNVQWPLNEGRGRNPGDRDGGSDGARRRAGALNEGRGRNPGDSGELPDRLPSAADLRSTKAGAETPATVRLSKRLHLGPAADRSTKAGAETPATDADFRKIRPEGLYAQRRPGPKPRRQHVAQRTLDAVTAGRSTKAGAETPATADRVSREDRVRIRRSTKAGAETPATAGSSIYRITIDAASLNEGRGRNPGDSPVSDGILRPHPEGRSTKAGAETPATAG